MLGVATIYLIRVFDTSGLNNTYEAIRTIMDKRDSIAWYQHILKGILCGACIEIACANFRKEL